MTDRIPVHLVVSTHWDREWYEPFQGFRYRLVSLLDELLDVLQHDPRFTHFQMDGQSIPIEDYLEIRPERQLDIRRLAAEGRIVIGPWYTLPDLFIVSGESLIRNLNEGLRVAASFGGAPSRIGFACDLFGHNSQMPQIFKGFHFDVALVWRGTNEEEYGSNFRWRSPDGTEILAYRMGPDFGYGDYPNIIRKNHDPNYAFDVKDALARLGEFIDAQRRRGEGVPILLFDGIDHLEIEPRTADLVEAFEKTDWAKQYELKISTLDRFAADFARAEQAIQQTESGELRDPVKPRERLGDPNALIPGVGSSRVHLKQQNARCETLLTLWAEPFSLFAGATALPYPQGFLRRAWRHLIANHAHDSICGCSPDQIHKDMLFRFDQAELIGERLKRAALERLALTLAAGLKPEKDQPRRILLLANPTSTPLDEPVDFSVKLPADTPCFQEFFGYERKPAFWLKTLDGDPVAYQRTGQRLDQFQMAIHRYKTPQGDAHHLIDVTARVPIPAYGYTTLEIETSKHATRHGGPSLVTGPQSAENEFLAIQIENGLLTLTDKRNGQTYRDLLQLEDCADLGDGWHHGPAINDQVFTSAGAPISVACTADGPCRATFRIECDWSLPSGFDFQKMVRRPERTPLRIVHEVTLRAGCDRVEVETTVDNSITDHRLRVCFPTDARANTWWADTAFDAVERPIALNPDHVNWREIEVEYKPQQSWSAVAGGGRGLAVLSQGLIESAVRDLPSRPIALTLLRAFIKAVGTTGQPGGQIPGVHTFRYWIVPIAGDSMQPARWTRLAQQLAAGIGQAQAVAGGPPLPQYPPLPESSPLPSTTSFLEVEGDVVVTALKADESAAAADPPAWILRLHNPTRAEQTVRITRPAGAGLAKAWLCDLEEHTSEAITVRDGVAETNVPSRRILTLKLT